MSTIHRYRNGGLKKGMRFDNIYDTVVKFCAKWKNKFQQWQKPVGLSLELLDGTRTCPGYNVTLVRSSVTTFFENPL